MLLGCYWPAIGHRAFYVHLCSIVCFKAELLITSRHCSLSSRIVPLAPCSILSTPPCMQVSGHGRPTGIDCLSPCNSREYSYFTACKMHIRQLQVGDRDRKRRPTSANCNQQPGLNRLQLILRNLIWLFGQSELHACAEYAEKSRAGGRY